MANEKTSETLDEILSDVPAEKQSQENGENKYVTNAFDKAKTMLQTARENGTAVWQADKETFKNIHCPVIVGKNKDGQDYSFYPATVNVISAIQEQHNRNTNDFRWMRASEAIKSKDIYVKEGAKAVDFVFYTKITKEQHDAGMKPKPYTVKMFNVSDLRGKNISAFVQPDHSRDMYARDMIFYMSRREANNTLSLETGKDYMKMIGGAISFSTESKISRDDWAKAQADARAEAKDETQDKVNEKAAKKVDTPEREALKEQQQARLDSIMAVDMSSKKPSDKFLMFMKEGYENNPRNYVSFAVEKAMKELKWTEKNVKVAITKFAPGAVYDGSNNKKPYADRVMDSIAKGKEQAKGAAR